MTGVAGGIQREALQLQVPAMQQTDTVVLPLRPPLLGNLEAECVCVRGELDSIRLEFQLCGSLLWVTVALSFSIYKMG